MTEEGLEQFNVIENFLKTLALDEKAPRQKEGETTDESPMINFSAQDIEEPQSIKDFNKRAVINFSNQKSDLVITPLKSGIPNEQQMQQLESQDHKNKYASNDSA